MADIQQWLDRRMPVALEASDSPSHDIERALAEM